MGFMLNLRPQNCVRWHKTMMCGEMSLSCLF